MIELMESKVLGLVVMLIINFIACHIGMTLAFLLQPQICSKNCCKQGKPNKYISALKSSITSNPRRVIFLLRGSFMVPYSVLNYGCPSVGVNIVDYCIGNNGMIFVHLFYSYIGSTLKDFKDYLSGKDFNLAERAPVYAMAAVVRAAW